MAVDLERELHRAFPEADIALPDPGVLWERGRGQRTQRRRLRALAAAAAGVVLVVAGVAGALVLDGADRVEAPYIDEEPSVATIDLSRAPSARLQDLPSLGDLGDHVVVAALDGMLAFAEQNAIAWRETSELAPGDPLYRIVGRAERAVFYGGATAYAIDGDVDATVEPITTAPSFAVFVPSAHLERVWVQQGRTDGSPRPVWEVDIHGEVTVAPRDAPAGNVMAGVASGVVLQDDNQLVVWDPREDRVVTEVGGPFPMGAHGDVLAWCADPCRSVSVTDIATGDARVVLTIEGDARFSGYDGEISPDGRWLAVVACEADEDRGCALVVRDLAGEAVHVAGRGVVTGRPAWSPDGRYVAVELDGGRVGVLRPGEELRATDGPVTQEGHERIVGVAIIRGSIVEP